ncbi:MAG TPA: hypothetical protein VFV78_13320 [Vicinamibacterales bacterium]|nr:hypothetical protein [Vicinamibacterales bacterium]
MSSTSWRMLAAAVLSMAVMAQAKAPASLLKARQAYNAGQIDAAIAAAQEALKVPVAANEAAVVLGRAYLERFSRGSVAADLETGREALRQVNPSALPPRVRVEYVVAEGLSLYYEGCTDGCFGAAAEMFKVALAALESGPERDRVFEWWAGALDRQAQFGPDAERGAVYRRLLTGADAEVDRNDESAPATYWVVAAATGAGELERAWSASIAGWVRARTFGDRGATLRADLDRFVTQVLLPERARAIAPDADARPILTTLLGQWEEIKKRHP